MKQEANRILSEGFPPRGFSKSGLVAGMPGALAGLFFVVAFLAMPTPAAMANDELRLDCTPRTFEVVPGEPMRLELTVEADSALPLRLHVPRESLLKLRAVEKIPVRRTADGLVVYQRVVVWQGLEPGTVTIKNLSVEAGGQKLLFPEVSITVRDPAP